MLQEQNAAQIRDMNSLSARNTDLLTRVTEADSRVGTMAADLVTANTVVDQLRNEAANLRAEKQIWEVRGLRDSVDVSLTRNCRAFKLALWRRTRRCLSSVVISLT